MERLYVSDGLEFPRLCLKIFLVAVVAAVVAFLFSGCSRVHYVNEQLDPTTGKVIARQEISHFVGLKFGADDLSVTLNPKGTSSFSGKGVGADPNGTINAYGDQLNRAFQTGLAAAAKGAAGAP